MPFGIEPRCSVCKTKSSAIWRKDKNSQDASRILCNSCMLKQNEDASRSRTNSPTPSWSGDSVGGERVAAPLRGKKLPGCSASLVTQGPGARDAKGRGSTSRARLGKDKAKSRRTVMFKGNVPEKALSCQPTLFARSYAWNDGVYFQVGDVVAVCDQTDGDIYFAQVTGFLEDIYCDTNALIHWLVPKARHGSPGEQQLFYPGPAHGLPGSTDGLPGPARHQVFDPGAYMLGPAHHLPVPLDAVDFVCHAPSEYYLARPRSPYPVSAHPAVDGGPGSVYSRGGQVGVRAQPLTEEDVFEGTLQVPDELTVSVTPKKRSSPMKGPAPPVYSVPAPKTRPKPLPPPGMDLLVKSLGRRKKRKK